MSTNSPVVDYSLRPAKATVRRMMVDALSKLEPVVRLSEYAYVGMGSIFFRDFQVVHRRLGIADMTTIECNRALEGRVEFNRPYSSVKTIMEPTSSALPKIALEGKPHIVWLDYESRVTQGVMLDVENVVRRSAERSVIIVTVNADREWNKKAREKWLDKLRDHVSLPQPNDPKERAEYALLSYRLLQIAIARGLGARNAGIESFARVQYRQFLHFVYSDGTQMMMVGGILVGENFESGFASSGVEALDFARSGEQALGLRFLG